GLLNLQSGKENREVPSGGKRARKSRQVQNSTRQPRVSGHHYCDDDEHLATSAEEHGGCFRQWTISRTRTYGRYSHELQKGVHDHASQQACEQCKGNGSTRLPHFSSRDKGVFRAGI